MSLNVNAPFQYSFQKIFNGLVPREGPRAIPVPINFTGNESQSFDFFMQNELTYLSYVQCIYADNADNDVPIVIVWNGTQQRTIIPPRYQGYVPVLVLSPFKFVATGIGAAGFGLQLLNVPMPIGLWPTQQTIPNFDPSTGALIVTDPALDAIIAGGYLSVNPGVQGDDDIIRNDYKADILFTDTVDGSATPYTVLTGAPGWFMNAFDIRLSGDATLAAPGILTVQLLDNATVIAEQDIWLPDTPITNLPIIPVMKQTGLNFLSDQATQELFLVMSAALATGSLSYNIAAGHTAVVR